MPRPSQVAIDITANDKASPVLKKVSGGIAGITKFAIPAAAAVTAVGAVVFSSTQNYLDNADALQKMSLRTGETTESLGALEFAFGQADLSANDLERALTQLNRRKPEESIDSIADKIANLETIQEKTALATEAFGERLGPRLLTFLEQGSAGIERYRDEHRRLGLTITQESANAAATFNDQLDTINRAIEGASVRFGEAAVGIIAPFVQTIGTTLGFLPEDAETQTQNLLHQFESRVAAAQAAGLSLGDALADPITQRLQQMLLDAGYQIDQLTRLADLAARRLDFINQARGANAANAVGLGGAAQTLDLYGDPNLRANQASSRADIDGFYGQSIDPFINLRPTPANTGNRQGAYTEADIAQALRDQGLAPFAGTAWDAGGTATNIGSYSPFHTGAYNPLPVFQDPTLYNDEITQPTTAEDRLQLLLSQNRVSDLLNERDDTDGGGTGGGGGGGTFPSFVPSSVSSGRGTTINVSAPLTINIEGADLTEEQIERRLIDVVNDHPDVIANAVAEVC